MKQRKKSKYVHEGQYVAEVEVSLVEDDTSWSPYLRVLGTGGTVTLWANDQQIGAGTMPHSVALLFTTYASMDIGRDNGGVVDVAYENKAPHAFMGTVKKVVFDLK